MAIRWRLRLCAVQNPKRSTGTKNPIWLYSAEVDSKELLTKVRPFPKEINTKTHESNATFSADGRIMYFNHQ
jgi:hypothetical protein